MGGHGRGKKGSRGAKSRQKIIPSGGGGGGEGFDSMNPNRLKRTGNQRNFYARQGHGSTFYVTKSEQKRMFAAPFGGGDIFDVFVFGDYFDSLPLKDYKRRYVRKKED